MSEVMLDLETLSVRPNAVILVIGAIKFNRGEKWKENIDEKDFEKLNVFYKRINIDSCVKVGLHVDNETEKWWDQQADDLKYEALTHPDRVNLKDGLEAFKDWYGTNPRTKIWGNGSSFDCTILGEAYKRCGMKIPWQYFLERDLRTIMDLGNIRMCNLPQYQKHHALYDCYRQIIGFQRSEKNLRI
jgi:hypothetical protein